MSRLRVHRLDPWAAPGAPLRRPEPDPGWGVADRAAALEGLDLGTRIGLATDVQATAGNAAMTQLVGLVRSDHKMAAPDGLAEIIAKSGPGNRGLTRTAFTANPPLFRGGKVEQKGDAWSVKPAPVRLRPVEHDVYWPAPGLHKIRSLGKGAQYLDVSDTWSDKLAEGETEHVTDSDLAYEMTWGKVAAVLNKMAEESFTGPTTEDATKAAWQAFKRRLPEGLRPEGDAPTAEAQEKKWGADDPNTLFRKLMGETKRARDNGGWHTPDQTQRETRGDDRIDELSKGGSHIGEHKSEKVIKDAWDRLTKT